MAKAEKAPGAGGPTTAGPEKYEPTASVNWPKEVKLAGDTKHLALGTRCRVVLEGTVKGFSHRDYGGTIDLKVKTVSVEAAGADPETKDDTSESFVDTVRKVRSKAAKKSEA